MTRAGGFSKIARAAVIAIAFMLGASAVAGVRASQYNNVFIPWGNSTSAVYPSSTYGVCVLNGVNYGFSWWHSLGYHTEAYQNPKNVEFHYLDWYGGGSNAPWLNLKYHRGRIIPHAPGTIVNISGLWGKPLDVYDYTAWLWTYVPWSISLPPEVMSEFAKYDSGDGWVYPCGGHSSVSYWTPGT